MQIPAWMFCSFWALTGAWFLFLGIEALDKTDLSNSISPVVMSVFKHSLALSLCHSSTYALVFRSKLNDISVEKYYIWISFAVFPIFFSRIAGESFAWYFPIYSFINLFGLLYYFIPEMKRILVEQDRYILSIVVALIPLSYYLSCGYSFVWYFWMFITNSIIIFQRPFAAVLEEQTGLAVHFAAVSVLFLSGGKGNYFPALLLFSAFFTSAAWAAISGDERFQRWLPEPLENRVLLKLRKMMRENGKVIEFGIGMAGTIFFQNFFRLTSFDHVVAFLYFSVAWLANLAMLMCVHDFGIFNFLLGNVIVGCTVSQFGLRGTTWIAYGACLLLYSLRLKVEALTLVKRGEDEADVVVWRE